MSYSSRNLNFVGKATREERMSNLVEITDSLEDKIRHLLQKYDHLKRVNLELEERLQKEQANRKEMATQIEGIQQENQLLQSANALLGSKDFKKETKLKINSLIREIDHCIVQLSE